MGNHIKIGVVGKSQKVNEKRVPIHPDHIEEIPVEIRRKLTFEAGYGDNFGISDQLIAQLTSGVVEQKYDLLAESDCIIIPKPTEEDIAMIKDRAIVWGWLHCVQQKSITQLAIDKKLTFISWESMHSWSNNGERLVHVFHKNNEIAGFAAVNHAAGLIGEVGVYGRPTTICILGFGSVSRGAVYALKGLGFSDISVFTERNPTEVGNQIPGITHMQMTRGNDGVMYSKDMEGRLWPLVSSLANADIIVNGVLQDVRQPKMFVSEAESMKLKDGALIIDISCDEGMGFWCAEPTSFENPIFCSNGKRYYSVDHTPSLYWNSASWEMSRAILPFLKHLVSGENAWLQNSVLNRAADIKEGKIINKDILVFQDRNSCPPYDVK